MAKAKRLVNLLLAAILLLTTPYSQAKMHRDLANLLALCHDNPTKGSTLYCAGYIDGIIDSAAKSGKTGVCTKSEDVQDSWIVNDLDEQLALFPNLARMDAAIVVKADLIDRFPCEPNANFF
jgi:hypothetical protein